MHYKERNGVKMKRILWKTLSVIIVMTLAFSSVSIFAAVQGIEDGECVIFDYSINTAQDNAVSYLQMLGILGEIDTAANVTRGQAVSAVIRALGHEEMALNSGSMYTYDEKMAYFAHGSGILSGNSPESWNLDSFITDAQLSKILVVSLGYGAIITSPDAYPNEYLAYSSKLGLTKGVTSADGDYVSGGNFAIMLAHAMKADVLEIVGIQNNESQYEITGKTTLEGIYLKFKNLAVATGVVEADFYVSTVQNERCEENRIRIDGNIFVCESADFKGCVGSKVEFVYVDESREANRKIFGLRLADENKIYEFATGHSAILQNEVLYYEAENQKERKINISPDAVYVVNNTLLSSYNLNSLNLADYFVRIIDNDDNGKCDVVFLTKSESMIVNYVKDNIIYLSYGTLNCKNVIDLTDYDSATDVLVVRDINGNVKTLADITSGMSISVIASEDLNCMEIILLPDAQSGKFEEYSSTDNTVMVNGNIYKMKNLNNEFALGNTYLFRINENNEIFYIESIMSDCSYIVDVSNKSHGLSNSVKVKIFDNENGIQIFDTAEKVIVAGISYSDEQSIASAIEKNSLAYVSLNSENKIRKIEYLNKYGESAKRIYRQQATGFNDVDLAESLPFRFNEDTVFFYIPKSGDDIDFGFSLPLKNKDEYTTSAYEFNKETGFVKAVVVEVDNDMRTDNYITYNSDVGIVTSVKQVSDNDGQGVYKIEGYHDGTAFAYTSGHYDDVFSVCSALKAGDVIRYIANYNNEIVRIQKTVSLSDVNEYFHDGKDTVDERFFGRVITLSKNQLTNYSEYLCHEMNVSMNLSYNSLAYMRFWADLTNPYDSKSQFSNYYSYNKRTKEVSVASIDDIISYEMAGDAASEVFVQRSKSDVQCIVIVKE